VAAAPAGAWHSDLIAAANRDRALETAIGILVHSWRKRAGEEPEATLEFRIVEIGPRVVLGLPRADARGRADAQSRSGLTFDDLRVVGPVTLAGRAERSSRGSANGSEGARAEGANQEVGHAV
jgi:hypothetical protein